MSAQVEKRHREAAAKLIPREYRENDSELHAWIESGDEDAGAWWICDSSVAKVAQSIAEAEANAKPQWMETCANCGLPIAPARVTRASRVDPTFCGARFSAHYELQCLRLTVVRLRGEQFSHPVAERNSEALSLAAGMDRAWPLRDVLTRLADFADTQLREHDYDGHGWEELQRCVEESRRYLAEERNPPELPDGAVTREHRERAWEYHYPGDRPPWFDKWVNGEFGIKSTMIADVTARAIADSEAQFAAQSRELERLRADREHLDESRRLLSAVTRTMSFMRAIEATSTDLLSEDLTRWLDAERARKGRT